MFGSSAQTLYQHKNMSFSQSLFQLHRSGTPSQNILEKWAHTVYLKKWLISGQLCQHWNQLLLAVLSLSVLLLQLVWVHCYTAQSCVAFLSVLFSALCAPLQVPSITHEVKRRLSWRQRASGHVPDAIWCRFKFGLFLVNKFSHISVSLRPFSRSNFPLDSFRGM